MGQLHQGAEVCTQVYFAANQQHTGAGTVIQDFCLPLLQGTVHGLWAADVEAEEDSIRVTVAQGTDIVIIRRARSVP